MRTTDQEKQDPNQNLPSNPARSLVGTDVLGRHSHPVELAAVASYFVLAISSTRRWSSDCQEGTRLTSPAHDAGQGLTLGEVITAVGPEWAVDRRHWENYDRGCLQYSFTLSIHRGE